MMASQIWYIGHTYIYEHLNVCCPVMLHHYKWIAQAQAIRARGALVLQRV